MQESTDLRNRLSEALKSFNLKQVQVARDTGINNATLSLWLSGKCKGSTTKLDTAIEAWLNALYSARPKEPVTFAQTADCSRFHRLMQRTTEATNDPSELVPIRLDVEKDGRRVHEAFCWDIQEPYFTPETFAVLLCEDLSLPQGFQHEVADSIRKQLRRHERYRPMVPQCLKTLEIDLVIDNIVLKDKFVWDINNRRNSPEAFAQCVCADMGLGPEVATALAHAIREQVTYYQKKEQMRGTPVVEQLPEIYRSNPDEWEPKVTVLSPDEFLVERNAYARLDNIPFLVLQYLLGYVFWVRFKQSRGYSEVYFLLAMVLLLVQMLTYLGTHWNKKVLAWVCYKAASKATATHVLVQHTNEKHRHKGWSIVPLPSPDVLVFEHKRFQYDDDKKVYKKVTYPVGHQLSVYASSQGLESPESIEKARSIWVDNLMEIPIPKFIELMKEHVLAPFFVFQIFCVLLWMLDEYWYFSLYTLVMLLVFESIIVVQRQMNWRRMKKMRVPPENVTVTRKRQRFEMSSKDLLPGDLVSLEMKGTKLLVPCDLLLISGSCTVDESILTGESVPLLKESIASRNPGDTLELKRDGVHLLLSGTTVLKCTRGHNMANGPVCYVLRTGWDTTQGKLMRTILFSSERMSAGNWEAYIFILILLLFAVLATGYMLSHALQDPARDPYKLLLKCVLILTSVVPPELPIELALAVNASIVSLQRKQIFCTEPFRLPFAGRAMICCFDKTGTLTDMDFIVRGASLPGKSKTESQSLSPLDKSPAVALVLAGCNSLTWVDEKWAGDPIEKVCVEELKGVPDRDGIAIKTGDKVFIQRRFPFNADLKRMTTIARVENRNGSSQKVVTKGAPEVIGPLLTSQPAFYEETCTHLTSQGYRILCLAYRDTTPQEDHLVNALKRDEVEKNLTYAGLLALSSPIKPGTLETLNEIRKSSHKVVMITGDNVHTAAQVALDLNLGTEAFFLSDGGTTVELRNSVGELGPEKCPARAVVCALGKDLPLLAGTRWMARVNVFARTSPSQKEQIIDLLNKKGFTIMCGDGTNDVGGLKKAHVGIALLNRPLAAKPVNPMEMPRETVEFGDASIAAPFTSKISNISCVKFLIQHGRCTLVTTYQMYRILAVNCLIYAYTLSVLYMDGIKLGDTQSMIQGLVISVFFYFLSTAEPLNRLSKHRPPNSIFQPAIMLSIFIQFAVHLAALIYVVFLCQPFVNRGEGFVPDKEFKPDVLNSSVYLLNFWINVVNFLVNYQGEPFMAPLRENKKLYKMSLISLGVIIGGVFGLMDIDYYLELVQLPNLEVTLT